MAKSIVTSILFGIAIYIGTAIFLGKEKANRLPGGAIGALAFIQPWYIGAVFGLIGHFIAVAIAKKI